MPITIDLTASSNRSARLTMTAWEAFHGKDSIADLLVRLDEGIHTPGAPFVITTDNGESSAPIADITSVTIAWIR
ncbi:hypothetical protein AMIS_20050 [Actinoplanes missouriensis 431]|uniref:Uncharacterized protein n=1 Tax=Actinoplanes missouriensis (strain ATCC 14538 / DSM 43046 / CBS 188.64 / JCM 3121 / NBRC 102363 / NCIMB 12654 / NRRL B-3342 / UNCC 431) TaxID=512565 RepID=I0H2I8_ACTM4|nr:hypothetical protein [Actinoplanes missouriensis]KOX54708.1 hypothetical protein ADL19_13630 [Streptomyces purpurogeneiscleroticus]BAL87225.1 hypothetical protein AMIS_20050 [Actinoplanes missouriensis 431]